MSLSQCNSIFHVPVSVDNLQTERNTYFDAIFLCCNYGCMGKIY